MPSSKSSMVNFPDLGSVSSVESLGLGLGLGLGLSVFLAFVFLKIFL
jgi:hypothetical protein